MWFSAEFRSCYLGLILQMDAAAPTRLCDHCGAVAVSQCVRCKAAFYCRRKCQKFHWKRGGHKPICIAAAAAFNTPANRERLWQAAYQGHAAAALDLAVRGADVNYRDSDYRGCTPLFIAAQKGHDAVVRALLDAGADKDLADNNGATPLMAAAIYGHVTVARALLDAGADKAKSWRGKKAIDLAKTTEMKDLLS